jgi:hypothetical protein
MQLVCLAAGWQPIFGYETVVLVMAVAADQTLATVLTSVDLCDDQSVAAAVDELLHWRRRIERAAAG